MDRKCHHCQWFKNDPLGGTCGMYSGERDCLQAGHRHFLPSGKVVDEVVDREISKSVQAVLKRARAARKEEERESKMNRRKLAKLIDKAKSRHTRRPAEAASDFKFDGDYKEPPEEDDTLILECMDNTGMATYFDQGVTYLGEEVDESFYSVYDKLGEPRECSKDRFRVVEED